MQESDLQKGVKDPCLDKNNCIRTSICGFLEGITILQFSGVPVLKNFDLNDPQLDLDKTGNRISEYEQEKKSYKVRKILVRYFYAASMFASPCEQKTCHTKYGDYGQMLMNTAKANYPINH
jgi:hypothetical protein